MTIRQCGRLTLMFPSRQCSSSWPLGSSVYRLKPDVFLMAVSWLRRHWNSSTVVAASKLTTLVQEQRPQSPLVSRTWSWHLIGALN